MSESETQFSRKLEEICLDFQSAWTPNEDSQIGDYLFRIEEPYRERLLKRLLEIEFDLLEKAGMDVVAEDYRKYGELAERHMSILVNARQSTIPPKKTSSPESETIPPQVQSKSSNQIGHYKLLQQIGEGGMGSVWMAEQEEPVRRRVALKLIRGDMGSQETIARFEAERQALAMMDHQHIAKVLDAGTTPDGNPFFVMELVKGIPLTQYCDENKLTIRERLELFIPVCNAIQHAHQKGIIHRDLKPSNVLVTLYDGKPVPKVIDFGLAKALEHTTKLTDKTMFTEFGKVVGTVQYMAPEQAEMNALDVDTRTDVYSLGVMLYELLTGSTPLDKDTLSKNALLQILSIIREREPQRPSARLSSSGDTATGISEQRKITSTKLHQILRGELDWIVMKALEKDRTRRYETANGLAMDVERYLNNDVVLARPPSPMYRLQKQFRQLRKNPAAMAIVGIVLAILVIIPAAWIWVVQNRAASEREAEVNRLVNKVSIGTDQFAKSLDELESNWPLARSKIEALTESNDATTQLNAHLALARYEKADNEFLMSRLVEGDPEEVPAIVEALDLSGNTSLVGQVQQIVQNWNPADANRRSRFLSAMACLIKADPTGIEWDKVSHKLASALVDITAIDELSSWQGVFKSVGPQLVPGLVGVLKTSNQKNEVVVATRAAELLAEYCNDVDTFAKVLLDCEPTAFESIFNRLQESPEEAKTKLVEYLDSDPQPRFPSNHSKLQAITDDLRKEIEAARGLVTPGSIFCQTLPLASSKKLNSQLESLGYQLRKFRPFTHNQQTLVACVWYRGSSGVEIQYGLRADEIKSLHDQKSDEGYVAVDIAGYVDSTVSEKDNSRYAAIWRKSETEYSEVFVGLDRIELDQLWKTSNTYIKSLQSFQSSLSRSAIPRYELFSGIVSADEGSAVGWNRAIENFRQDALNRDVSDVCFSSTQIPESLDEFASRMIADCDAQIKENPQNWTAIEQRWQLYVYFGETEKAITDLDLLIAQYRKNLGNTFGRNAQSHLGHRAIQLAQQRKLVEMQNDLKEISDAYTRIFYATYSHFLAGEFEKGETYLQDLLEFENVNNKHIRAAMSLAVASKICAESDPSLSESYRKRALQRLGKMQNSWPHSLQHESLAIPLRNLKGFSEQVIESDLDQSYGYIRALNSEVESEVIAGCELDDSANQQRELIQSGYRVASMNCKSVFGRLVTASVWHRPFFSEKSKQAVARRRARALIALVRLNFVDDVINRLSYDQDARNRTHFIHWFRTYGADPPTWSGSFLTNERVHPQAKIAVLQLLGNYQKQDFKDDDFAGLLKEIEFCHSYPHAGIHASADWLLRKWQTPSKQVVQTMEQASQYHKIQDAPSWYSDPQVGEMVTIPIGKFLGGSILRRDPEVGSTTNLPRRFVSVQRPVAIATKPIELQKYLDFVETMKTKPAEDFPDGNKKGWLKDVDSRLRFIRSVVTNNQSPATKWGGKNNVLAFCNWLSEEAGMPKEQWCYEKKGDSGEWQPKRGFASYSGYRLPTIEEWEVACRAGTTTRRFFGYGDEFATHYAWYLDNSESRTHPFGQKLPNDWGLFDLYGNIWEICHNDKSSPGTDYDGPLARMRSSAFEGSGTANYNHEGSGIRIARTLVTSRD